MKPFKSFLLGAVISFWGAFLALPLLGWNIEAMSPQSNCSFFGEKKIQSGFLDRISLRFWVRTCQPQNIFIGSSEATGDHSLPFYLQQKGYDFSYFVGAHRGIKSLGYLMAHELSKSRSENLKILAFINPIYFSPGPAQTSAPMVYRSAVSVRLLERFVKGSGEGAEESFDQFIFLSAKGLIADIFDLLNEVPQKTFVKELREPDFKATPPLDYDLSHGVYKRHVHNNFTSDFDINIHPVDSFTRQIIANKNNLKICLVLLPLNERFFMSKGEKYKSQIADFYQKYRERFSPLPLVDLTSLGQSDFLFADTMHFTEFGSSQVMSKVMESKCFKELFGE